MPCDMILTRNTAKYCMLMYVLAQLGFFRRFHVLYDPFFPRRNAAIFKVEANPQKDDQP
jgi:hypothetical protein